jgi:tricorn protease-like protein
LESRKIRCWIAPRDIIPGTDYAASLIENLNNSRIMVLVFSQESNNSSHVMREVERAVSKGIPIIPLRIENVNPTKAMEYYLSMPHWLDALTPPLEMHLEKLAQTVQILLQTDIEKPPTPVKQPEPLPVSRPPKDPYTKNKRKRLYLIAASLVLVTIIVTAALFLPGFPFAKLSSAPSSSSTPTASPTSGVGITTPTPSTSTPSTSNPSSGSIISLVNAAQVKQIDQIPTEYVAQLAWSPDGKYLATTDGSINIYDTETKSLAYSTHIFNLRSLAFSSDGRLLVGGGTGGLYTWNVDGWGRSLSNPDVNIACLALSPDGKTIAAGVGETVKLFDITSGNEIRTMPAGGSVDVIAFSPDGKTIASSGGSMGMDIIIWNAQTGEKLQTLSGHTSFLEALAFSPDSQTLASGSWDKTVMLWNPTSGSQLRVITGHTDFITCVAFSPNGQLLASGSWDLTVRLWNTQTGQQQNVLTGHSNRVVTAAFSPDGTKIASGSDLEKGSRLWGL